MIDLHCHSNFSDGTCTPNELLEKANKLNLTYFSITDHDNCFAYENIDKSIYKGTLINGVEIVTSFKKQIIEILGYGVDVREINNWKRKNDSNNIEYAFRIYELLIQIFNRKKIEYTRDININDIICNDDPTGKLKLFIYNDLIKYEKNKHIIEKNVLDSYSNFNKNGLNNPNSILFIEEYKRFLSINEAVELIHKSGGLCFLAHIYQYNVENHIEFLKELLKEIKLDGIETFHSSYDMKQTSEINNYAEKLNLYKCGGSDYHGKLKPNILLGLNCQISSDIIKPWINLVK